MEISGFSIVVSIGGRCPRINWPRATHHTILISPPPLGILIPHLRFTRSYHSPVLISEWGTTSPLTKGIIGIKLIEEVEIEYSIIKLPMVLLRLIVFHLHSEFIPIAGLSQLSINVALLLVTLVPEVI